MPESTPTDTYEVVYEAGNMLSLLYYLACWALAILFICQNGGGRRLRRQLCRLPQQMRRSGKEAEEITLTSLCEGGGPLG